MEKYINAAAGTAGTAALAAIAVAFLVIGIGIGYVAFSAPSSGNSSIASNATICAAPSFAVDRAALLKQINAMSEIQQMNGVNVTLMLVSTGLTADGLIEANISDSSGQESPMYFTKEYKYLALALPPVDLVNYSAVMKASLSASAQPANVSKSDKPTVELFVMSYCPYGTQAEKGVIPVAEALKGKMDFSVKFVYYTMHGYKEAVENTRQYCIEKEQNDKYIGYLACFLNNSDAAGCTASTGLNTSSLDACMNATYAKYNITENSSAYGVYDLENALYGVQGSPTLIINGAEVSAGRDSASLLSAVCNAFTTKPAECGTALSSVTPSAGFGYSTSGDAGAAAQCR
jgi:hypothetical protein